jgi:hypothetical protein
MEFQRSKRVFRILSCKTARFVSLLEIGVSDIMLQSSNSARCLSHHNPAVRCAARYEVIFLAIGNVLGTRLVRILDR